jgi:saccharopine dehydrogenase-like NADP-dependent oxidoreductase
MKMLLEDLRLKERRGLLKDILETSVPITHQDVVLIFVVVTGMREGRLTQENYAKKIYAQEIDGTPYEAFNTSGGLGSLAETHGVGVESMNYKTIRYPGHCAQMRLLMNDLKLNQDRATLKRVLENAVPQTLQDVVIVYAAVTGTQEGDLREENYVNKIYPQLIAGRLWSAIQVSTAAGITAVVDLTLQHPGEYGGFVAQEQFRLGAILSNRFGRHYASGGTKDISAEVVVSGKAGKQRRLAGAL